MLQKAERDLVFRPQARGLPHLPFGVRSTGYYRLPLDWREAETRKNFIQLFWIESGEGASTVGGKVRRLQAGDVFLYHPGDTHNMRAVQAPWSYAWMTFDHPRAAAWLADSGLPARGRRAGPCPVELFSRLRDCLRRSRTPADEQETALLALRIVMHATVGLPSGEGSPLVKEAKQRMESAHTRANWGMTELAAELGVHRTTLFRVFSAGEGLAPSDYLRRLRLQESMRLLRETRLPVAEVAARSGFLDPNYFARALRQATGFTPLAMRRQLTV